MLSLSPVDYKRPSRRAYRRLISSPTVEPVSVNDYNLYTRINNDPASPDLVNDKLAAARVLCEQWCRRSFVAQTWDLWYDLPIGLGSLSGWSWAHFFNLFPEASLTLPLPPLISIIGIYVTDDSGTETTVAPSCYWISRSNDPGRVALRATQDWPDTGNRCFETFRIRFQAGYLTPFTAAASSPNLTAANHGRSVGDIVRISICSGGNPPGGLAANTDYYVVTVPDANTLQLSATSGGSAITAADAGQGGMFLGTLPGPIKRAILAAAVGDRFEGPARKMRPVKGVDQMSNTDGLPELARSLLQPYRLVQL